MILNEPKTENRKLVLEAIAQNKLISEHKDNPYLFTKLLSLAYFLYSEKTINVSAVGPTDFDIVILPCRSIEYGTRFCAFGVKNRGSIDFFAILNLEQNQGEINRKADIREENMFLYRDLNDIRKLSFNSEIFFEENFLVDLISI